jgi:hypothetical protein
VVRWILERSFRFTSSASRIWSKFKRVDPKFSQQKCDIETFKDNKSVVIIIAVYSACGISLDLFAPLVISITEIIIITRDKAAGTCTPEI